jgi:RHS repeat-associated protein
VDQPSPVIVLVSGSVVNETQYEYDKFGVVKKIYQEWTGAVNTGTSPKVQYAYSFPTDGTTGLRVTSVTHPDGTVVTYEYNSGTDDTLSRLSGKKKAGAWIFQEEYLGLGRIVQRKYGDYISSEVATWTLVGTDTSNNDNYVGLGRFGEIDDLVVKDSSSNNINRYLYTYNYNSQITFREDAVGTVYGYYDFDEKWEYDGIGRLENHKRGRDLNGSPTIRVHECWTLDLSGNTTSFYTGTASTCGTGTSRALNDSNEYTQVGSENYGYDKPGDMTDRGSSDDKKYDAWKRLMSYENGSGFFARYKYNGLNQKVKRTDSVTGLADTYYFYSAENQLLEEEKVSDGTTLHYYVWGTQYIDDIVCRNSSGYNQFHVLDARNNVVTIVLYNGTVDKRFLYESYGLPKQLSADWTTFQTINSDWHLFQGRQYCVDHEQYDFRNRFQDPELGVFVQRDPIGNWGDSGNFGNPYTFVGNDPLNRVDPSGSNQLFSAPDCSPCTIQLCCRPIDRRLLRGFQYCYVKYTDACWSDSMYYLDGPDSPGQLSPQHLGQEKEPIHHHKTRRWLPSRRRFSGVLGDMPVSSWDIASGRADPHLFGGWAVTILSVLDLPLSMAADTVILPLTIYYETIGLERCVRAARDALHEEDGQEQLDALNDLRLAGPRARDARSEVSTFLSHDDANMRRAAIWTLSAIGVGDARSATTLLGSLEDENAEVRAAAVRSLCRVGVVERDVMAGIEKAMLSDPSIAVRCGAAEALGFFRDDARSAVPGLRRMLQAKTKDERRLAARALGRIGGAAIEAIPDLRMIRDDPDPDVRDEVERAIRRIDRSCCGSM